MRVSQHYRLGVSQPSLEFLDVDMATDTPVFIDPHAFQYVQDDWGRECVALLQDFYDEVLTAVRAGDQRRGLTLLGHANESNEVHLGLSKKRSQGSGVGPDLARGIYAAIASSGAITSGLTQDVEDILLFVEGVGHDRVSDMTINVVRRQLIAFTQEMCHKYGIPMRPSVESGAMWDRANHRWVQNRTYYPIANSQKLLLVPKSVVRRSGTFDPGDYLNNFVLPYLVDVELEDDNSSLIQRRAAKGKHRGAKFVTKKSIVERDGKPAKLWNTEVTARNPSILEHYRASRADKSQPPPHNEIAALTGTDEPDWDQLLGDVLSIPSGKKYADDYHRAVQNLLNALFYPALDLPRREFPIHAGRKRIDIMYVNMANDGFFNWMNGAAGVECPQVVVECKNYTGALANPEFDQLAGRFSQRRGRLGLLLYRGFKDNKDSVIQHCRDACLDNRGVVIALDDKDLKKLVKARKSDETLFPYLLERYRELI